jgi:nicotinamide-nucleotide adenylyltransferase
MSHSHLDMASLQTLRSQFTQSLKDFASSPSSTFKILISIPPSSPPSSSPIRTLYVLDSSFNPPSKAHLALVKNALRASSKVISAASKSQQNENDVSWGPPPSHTKSRVLFLLATVNADKSPEPAAFPDRLVMMTLMAEELRASFHSSSVSSAGVDIDIGVTKEPYFIDKATSIDESGVYTTLSPNPEEHFEQIHLTGFDTLVRIFTAKYYPNHTPPLSALEPFLMRHRVRATVRVDEKSPSKNLQQTTTTSGSGSSGRDLSSIGGQKAYLRGLGSGDLEAEGMKREWADRVELVVDETGETEGVSSTKIRNAVKEGKWDDVDGLVGRAVGEWVRERGLYKEEPKI